MRRSLLMCLLAVCATGNAEVFRHIGPDGEVYFSDQAIPGSERVELRPAQTFTMPEVSRPSAAAATGTGQTVEDKAGFTYAQFEIVKPSYDQGVRSKVGSVTIYMSLQPALRQGHAIELSVDGEDGVRLYSGEALNVNLSDMSRGRHTVEARVKNARDETMIKTGPVGFYVLRALGPRPAPR